MNNADLQAHDLVRIKYGYSTRFANVISNDVARQEIIASVQDHYASRVVCAIPYTNVLEMLCRVSAVPADALRVVCSWCLTEMSPGVEPTSHGICARCSREVFRDK